MAPEQILGESVDARSDLFALGCVLSSALVRHSPFQGRNVFEMARRIANHQPSPLHTIDAAIPEFLSDIIARLLQKKPDDRFQSAAEVADLLTRYLTALNQSPSDRFESVLHSPFKIPAAAGTDATGSKRWRIGTVAAVIGIALILIMAS